MPNIYRPKFSNHFLGSGDLKKDISVEKKERMKKSYLYIIEFENNRKYLNQIKVTINLVRIKEETNRSQKKDM